MSTHDRTDDVNSRRARLTGVAVLSLLLAIPAFMAWCVNLEVALRGVLPSWPGLIGENPGTLLHILVFLSGDLSTVSTLVPLLLLAFPLVQSLRILRRPHDDIASIHAMEALPYPAHFPFFLVMLGLTGTLYGLWIGLSVSGVSAMTERVPNAEELPVVLDRLLDGTATALLSSLIGLIGAFLAAKPLPYLFERAACIEPVEEERSLADTIDHLTRDLKALSAASREFSAGLQPDAISEALDAVRGMETAVNEQTSAITNAASGLERLEAGQRDGVAQLEKLDGIAENVSQTGQRFDQAAGLLESMIQTETRVAELLGELLSEVRSERRESVEQLTALRKAVEDESAAADSERSQLRKAFATFAGGSSRG
ncbi:MAG: hypothetical protein QGH42_09415 [Kiritimatiellia bacterium]|jgi:hypothetical protein|nr:hypothetical protein [Kiritimatiellia bacterium]MDP6629656.1 hypothetical protein [Kiritimatiellia bacterium]MDP6811100.1 hypothetical protein [Kiritimatiellia bacterium]MDP7024439.1 hypothetical protein [Kiritimatiellia bacterium]